jgi:hypothetical protein
MRPRLLVVLLAVAAVGVALAPTPRVWGCAVAPPAGGWTDVSTETAVIVWDEKAKVQHFIRSASFQSTSAEFGFLVATPSQPKLEEATGDGFDLLERATAPREETRVENAEFGCFAMSAKFDTVGAVAEGVEVLEEKRVGAYDAAVLRADDPDQLYDWLAKNGYDARPELKGWLKAYTENKWVVTAFKVAAGAKPSEPSGREQRFGVAGSVVRMSFPTDRPFFPYREPADQRQARSDAPYLPRMLRVYFLAEARYDGKIGDGSTTWPGRAVWSNAIDTGTFAAVAKAGKLDADLGGRAWRLTEFEDRSSPRPGVDELYFQRSPDQGTLERPPHVRIVYRQWPAKLAAVAVTVVPILLVAAIGLFVVRRMKKPV